MDAERTIAEIETLEQIFALTDSRPPSASDIQAANGQHDRKLARNPWFRLWETYWK